MQFVLKHRTPFDETRTIIIISSWNKTVGRCFVCSSLDLLYLRRQLFIEKGDVGRFLEEENDKNTQTVRRSKQNCAVFY